jgi:ATP-dependent RNA helicase DeaD
LHPTLAQTLSALGYEAPTPIQCQTIPLLLSGRDLIGQAQTGSGKTAAFALPILHQLDLRTSAVQALILTPTRELAIQVSEAIHAYGKQLGRVRVAPIYGGDSMVKQMHRLKDGLHLVVGTPGRVMDHLRRGTLDLSTARFVVLDEADEMLKMGFIEDVEWILEQAAGQRQTALFSATMPREVRRIAERHLRQPALVEIHHPTVTVPTVEQSYIHVLEKNKLDALSHILEADAALPSENGPAEATLIFVRTKIGAAELAERLDARGYAVEAMHGDMNQQQRETVIRRMREGLVEIVVATDVAARGLDVEHISRVINYDIPNDPESYVHRIGRTARAGRAGKAIMLLATREIYMLREIERYIGQKIPAAKPPSHADVAARRRALFKSRLLKALEADGLELYRVLIEELAAETERDILELAAAAAWLGRGSKPLITAPPPPEPKARVTVDEMTIAVAETVMVLVDVGRDAGIRPADLVGAIANETGLPGKYIGPINIAPGFSLVGVPEPALENVLTGLVGVTIRGQAIKARPATATDRVPRRDKKHPGKPFDKRAAKPAFEPNRKPRKKFKNKK